MATTTCARHPDVETRLTCASCGTPICPRCAVPTPVGQKCRSCARQVRSTRARGKPRQYAKAAGAGTAAATVVAVGLWALFTSVGLLTWIASGVGGYAIGRAVRTGGEGNAAPPFLWLALGLALVAVLGAWIAVGVTRGVGPIFVPGGLGAVTYAAAGYGAYLVFR